ncbi:hypothetical protein OG777_13940 [Micromonospora peucetia]|uniref:Uncharacterized protein n=1 Tax=Micromonospora peucetia TaxID=47871 RepID=A0A1C6VWN4_9ACTN|nr:hypothetical protein [Micromonospora peucetia]MCX4388030.1 hypothetical protein [Micromonospora peucetia]WSA31281.1 hypothetical protein OIE14_24550 [Micromonospora peucetia]SCL70300.1 hypothetical protein GA0070608_4294 [Micromonospora peucetia]
MRDDLTVSHPAGSAEEHESADTHPAGEIKLSFLGHIGRRTGILTGLMIAAPAIAAIIDTGGTGGHSSA